MRSSVDLFQCLSGVLLLDMDAMDFRTVVNHLVDEISNQNDLTEEARVDVRQSLFLPHKFVDSPNVTASLSLDGLRRRLSRSATRASIHRLPDVSGFESRWTLVFDVVGFKKAFSKCVFSFLTVNSCNSN